MGVGWVGGGNALLPARDRELASRSRGLRGAGRTRCGKPLAPCLQEEGGARFVGWWWWWWWWWWCVCVCVCVCVRGWCVGRREGRDQGGRTHGAQLRDRCDWPAGAPERGIPHRCGEREGGAGGGSALVSGVADQPADGKAGEADCRKDAVKLCVGGLLLCLRLRLPRRRGMRVRRDLLPPPRSKDWGPPGRRSRSCWRRREGRPTAPTTRGSRKVQRPMAGVEVVTGAGAWRLHRRSGGRRLRRQRREGRARGRDFPPSARRPCGAGWQVE